MSKETTPKENKGLPFEEATRLTIEEAVQKESDLANGITEQDGVLDKYIKKNRDKIGEQKFVNKDKTGNLPQVDTSTLDKFIEKQRQELNTESLMAEQTVVTLSSDSAPVVPVTNDLSKVAEIETFYGDKFTDSPKLYKHRKWIMGGMVALLLTTVSLAYGFNQVRKQSKTDPSLSDSSTTKVPQNSSSSGRVEASDVQAFEDLYKTFFADEALTKPKNSEFDRLDQLEKALKKLDGTPDHEAAKVKYDTLTKAIQAIQAVNEQFESSAIVDGEKTGAKLREGANLDVLSTAILNTGRASLDTLLQGVITQAKMQQQEQDHRQALTDKTMPILPQDNRPPKATEFVSSDRQHQASRVPYNEATIADSQNPAWTFTPGVLEEILRISRERGYITGDNYILEPVNIINGNGYYNMFKPDGTYLFSINAKTGYFVGNGAGYAEDLDY